MASEIQTESATGKTLYAVIRNAAAQVWNTSGTPAFEAYNSANYANYAVTMTEQGATGFYVGSLPTGANMPRGVYSADIRTRAGGSPAVSDTQAAFGSIGWDGTKEVALANVSIALPAVAPGGSGGLPTVNASNQVTSDISALVTTAIPNVAAGASGGLAKIGETNQLLDAADIAAIWAALTSGMSTAGSIGLLLKTALAALTAPGSAGGLPVLGETAALLDAADTAAIVTALLTAAISPTSRPTIGTVAEALAAARAAAIGNKTRTANAVVVKASDDTTTFSTLTFDNISGPPLTEVRS